MTWKFGISSKSSAGAIGCCRSPARPWMSCCGNIRRPTAATLARLLEKAERERLEQRSPVGARELFAFLRQLLG